MRITAQKLRAKGACGDDIKVFEKRWPDGCNVTRKNCEIAFRKLEMNVEWATAYLLSASVFKDIEDAADDACDKCWESKGPDVDCVGHCNWNKVYIEAFYQAAKGKEAS